MDHVELTALEPGLQHIRRSPAADGTVELIVRRPVAGAREVIAVASLDPVEGVVGDSWRARANGTIDPATQVTLMNARCAALIARTPERWALAGDQLYVDLDISVTNLPPGSRLHVGSAVLEVSAVPHRGCGKFVRRFGVDAMRFVNSAVGRELNLRGINARVLTAGTVRTGDAIRAAAA